MMSTNGHKSSAWRQADWFSVLLRRALRVTDDVDLALRSTEAAMTMQPFPDETSIDKPGDEPDDDWREEAEPIGTSDGVPVDALMSYDIHDKRAQGVLNRALKASATISVKAKKDLEAILKLPTPQQMAARLQTWGVKYRSALARLLGNTQLAAVLAGMQEVAAKVPTAPPIGTLPPTLEPTEAMQLAERIRGLRGEERERAIYELPPEQQEFVRNTLASEPPPSRLPPAPRPAPAGPEDIHLPIIEEAERLLREKRLVTRPEFDRLDAASRAKAFTVAGVDAEETLGKIRDAIAANIAEAPDYESFRAKVMEEVEPGTFLSDGHMENVFRTNIQTQFSDGQEEILDHPFVTSAFPYRSYNAIHDDRVRPEHLSMESHGLDGTNVYRAIDPVWQRFRPPWAWMCRCNGNPITVQQAAEKGISEAQKWLKTGVEPSPPAFVQPPLFEPPASFQRALAAAPLSIRLSMESLDLWDDDSRRKSRAIEPAAVEVGPQAEGGHLGETMGDTAAERQKDASHRMRPKRSGKGKRRLRRGMRHPRRWVDLSIELAEVQSWPIPDTSIPKGNPESIPTPFTTPDPPPISTGNVAPEPATSGRKLDSGGKDADARSERGLTAIAHNAPEQWGVWDGWSPLKAVIVGIPDNDVLPKFYPNKDNLNGNEVDLTGKSAGQRKSEYDPARFRACVEQMDNLCELLEGEGVTVYRPPLTPLEVGKDAPVGLSASWVRESFSVFGKTIVMNQQRAPHRRKELAALLPFFEKMGRQEGCRLIKPPPVSGERQPDWENDPRVFIEGGDVFHLGNKQVLLTMSYLASSPAGFRWLTNALEPDGWEVFPGYLTMDWLHGDYILSKVRAGLVMAYLPAFVDGLLPAPLTDWDVIELTRDEAEDIRGGNGIAIRPGTVVLPNPTRRLERALERKGVDVIPVDFGDVIFWQGGVDCCTCPLWRA